MSDQHGLGGLAGLSSTGSTSSGGLAARFKQNPLGVIGTALQSFIEGAQGKPISAVGREADRSKREFERRRLAVLESGEARAISAEQRAVKKQATDEASQKRKDAEAQFTFRLSAIASVVEPDSDEVALQNVETMRRHAIQNGDEELLRIANRLEALRKSDPDLQEAKKVAEDTNLLNKSQFQRAVTDCAPLSPNKQAKCFKDSVAAIKKELKEKTRAFSNSELLATIALEEVGAEVPESIAPEIRDMVKAAAAEPGGLEALKALAQTRVVTDKPGANRQATIRAKIANVGTLSKFSKLMIGFIDTNPEAFGGPGAIRDPITNIVQVMRDLGGSVIPSLSALVVEARNEAIQTGDAEVIDLFTKFDPTFPQTDVIVNAMAVLYARALRSVSGGERGGISIKEVQRAEKVLKIRGVKGVPAIREVFATLDRVILPSLKTAFEAELGGLSSTEQEQLEQFEQDFNLGQ